MYFMCILASILLVQLLYTEMGRHKRLFIISTNIPIDSEINDQSYELSATEGDQSAGTNYGEISVWDVGTRERMVYKPFKVWDLSSSSMSFRWHFLRATK
ncbi:hypothetical protein Lser_V15G00454 [Lactuca serriola]